MSDELKEELNDKEVEQKGPLQKLKDKILPDEDEQAAIISTFVRLGVLVWSGGILTLNYVAIPGVPQQKIDPTFIASVFTGVLASFGIQTAKNKDKGASANSPGSVTKADMEKLLEKAANTAPAQTIRIEQAPMVLAPTPNTPKKSG